ncbi:hypothetical protein [Microbacterium sp. NPDC056234]|uniref:hypothetical protein n=1 Tax=Microbacterium sp. NPDC056234 TaxID=3345757 RepID=UPI0035E19BE1
MTDEERYGDVATTFSLTTSRFNDGSEVWSLQIVGLPEDSEPDEDDVLVNAVVYRALINRNWFERFDSVDQELASIGENLLDRDLLEQIDEETAFASQG